MQYDAAKDFLPATLIYDVSLRRNTLCITRSVQISQLFFVIFDNCDMFKKWHTWVKLDARPMLSVEKVSVCSVIKP
jgi:hypothetical protein